MNRRRLIAALGGTAAALPFAARAQQKTMRRLALYSPAEPVAVMRRDSSNTHWRVLFEELRRLGHVEGQNLKVERYAREQNTAGSDAMAAGVVSSNPDCVYVVGAAPLFKSLTKTIPIVAITNDPVSSGVVQS